MSNMIIDMGKCDCKAKYHVAVSRLLTVGLESILRAPYIMYYVEPVQTERVDFIKSTFILHSNFIFTQYQEHLFISS